MDRAEISDSRELSKLVVRQALLVDCLGDLFRYAKSRGYRLTLAEGYVTNPRKTRDGGWAQDGVHRTESLHYDRLAQDLNLFVDGELINDPSHFAWLDLGSYWCGLDPLCAWGGNFESRDAVHFSIRWGGRA